MGATIHNIITPEEYRKFVIGHTDQVMDFMTQAEQLGRKRCEAFLATGGDGMMQHMIAFANCLAELPTAKALLPANTTKLKVPEPIDMLTMFVAIALNELLLPVILESSKPAAKALN